MILICSAWEEEIKYLRSLAEKRDLRIETIGIGYINAILSLQKVFSDARDQNQNIEKIIFLGTCGVYDQDPALINQIVNVHSTEILMLGTSQNISYSLDDLKEKVYSSEDFNYDLSAHCLSSLEITKDDQVAEQIKKYYQQVNENLLVENLELYGVAAFAQEHGIKWNSLLGITNLVGKNAHEEWKGNHVQVSKKLCEHAEGMTDLVLS